MAENETDRERERLRGVLAEGHSFSQRRTPPFEEVWSRAVAESSAATAARRRVPRLRWAAAAVAVTAVALATTMALWIDSRRSRQLDRALTAAAAVSDFQAPLDFLLDTPGREWLAAPPPWDPADAAGSWSYAPLELPATEPQSSDST